MLISNAFRDKAATMENHRFWQTKVHARLHDPIEKALVLMRDPAGHENGTSLALARLLFRAPVDGGLAAPGEESLHRMLLKNAVPVEIYELVRRADHWAAAADRPQWPMEDIEVKTRDGALRTLKVADWAQVHWARKPVIRHPLTGVELDIEKHGALKETDYQDIKDRARQHLESLIVRTPEGEVDWRRTLLTLWRFGPDVREEADSGKLGALWRLLPADTRVPDHSIWDHLDLTSAFAGAFARDPNGEVSLLTLTIGPVQGFIAAARSTSDLWAGSHLLSRLSWEAMRPVCETLGPDAILFPRLREVPQVDLWLQEQLQDAEFDRTLFQSPPAQDSATDSNPLFTAALPNRFVALVPTSEAAAIAERVTVAVRGWLEGIGKQVVDELLDTIDHDRDPDLPCYQQMREQLEGFPEVHWAAVPFSLAPPRDGKRSVDPDVTPLREAMAPFFDVAPEEAAGFLASEAWSVLDQGIQWPDRTTFFAPNPGVLYPALFDLGERVLAAAKATRAFAQSPQQGWRCSLTGETEWLTLDRRQLAQSYRQQSDTLWAQVHRKRPAWAKKGEHLSALAAIKRLWPSLFVQEIGASSDRAVQRFVISTHTMAIASQLDAWLESSSGLAPGCREAIQEHDPERVALPRRLVKRHRNHPLLNDARRLGGLLEAAGELGDEDPERARRLRDLVRKSIAGDTTLETYYALVLLDGDSMGAWLSGDPDRAISYLESFHPQVARKFSEHATGNDALRRYGEERRALSPSRHLAISGALNDFSLHIVRHVIEEEHLGRVIYAGGDDVLAMLPVADLFPALNRLNQAYQGHDPDHEGGTHRGLNLHNGFAMLHGRLYRMMGPRATASAGAVIAHHQAPLGYVLRELRAAEGRAKNEGGRDAFSLTLIKRSGGSKQFTDRWGQAPKLLARLHGFLADPGVSRRAAYNTLAWLQDLPEPDGDGAMLESLLAYQFKRQSDGRETTLHYHDVPGLARDLVDHARTKSPRALAWLENALVVAEFMAREMRNPDYQPSEERSDASIA